MAKNKGAKNHVVMALAVPAGEEAASIDVVCSCGESLARGLDDIYAKRLAEMAKRHKLIASCEGFHWIGQSFEFCDNCGRPAWEHRGHHIPGSPFTDDGGTVREWEPGEADKIRAKWEGYSDRS